MATESIYNLIPQPVPPPVKEALYRSKHPGDKPTTFSTFGLTGTSKPGYVNVAGAEEATKGGQHEYKKPFATMGKDGNAVPPTEVLKKKTGGGGGAYAAAMGLSDQSKCCLMPFCARECLRRAAPRWRRRGQSCRWTHSARRRSELRRARRCQTSLELQRLATSRAAASPAGLEQARRRRVAHSAD
jgi:hypothetical protein